MKKPLLLLTLILLVSALWAGGGPETPQNRYALVIGNSNYPGGDRVLPNTIKDTADISKALSDLGYNVVLKNDLTKNNMIREIVAFADLLKNSNNSEGFFWFAGHGMAIDGENYLLPLDVETDSESMVKGTAYPVSELTKLLASTQNKANVVVLDACRTPLSIGGRGRSYGDVSRVIKPASIRLPPDMITVFSTSEGYEAKDGPEKGNSPFAQAFLKYMKDDVPVSAMIARVTKETYDLTSRAQLPELRGQIISNENYSLNPASVSPVQPNPAPSPSPAPTTTPRYGGFSQTGKVTHELNASGFSIAHPSLPLNSKVAVRNNSTGKEIEVTVVSRLPASSSRIADLSASAWIALDLTPNTEVLIRGLAQ